MILMIDNYDSFTYNLVQYFAKLGEQVDVYRNDEISLDDIKQKKPDYLVISPGPCNPDKAGISLALIDEFVGHIPILGVCLGHQCIGQAFGSKIVSANEIMHGRTSLVSHKNNGVFKDLKNPMTATRYHSLVIEKTSLPACLEVTAWTDSHIDKKTKNGTDTKKVNNNKKTLMHSKNLPENWQTNENIEIMGVKHKTMPIEGIQFHPESILSESGHELLKNFLTQYR